MELVTRIIRNRLAAFGAVMLLLILIVSLLTPVFGLTDPNAIDTSNRFMLPFGEGHLLGADHLGRDILSRLLWGTRLSPVSYTQLTLPTTPYV